MPRPNKILQVLEEADRTAFEEQLRTHPAMTLDEGVEWLAERGYSVSRKAVWTYRKNLGEQLAALKETSEFARSVMSAARSGGAMEDIADANLLQLQIKLSEVLFRDGDADAGELMKVAIALKGGVATKKELEEIKSKAKAALAGLEKKAAGGVVTQADIEDAGRAIFG